MQYFLCQAKTFLFSQDLTANIVIVLLPVDILKAYQQFCYGGFTILDMHSEPNPMLLSCLAGIATPKRSMLYSLGVAVVD